MPTYVKGKIYNLDVAALQPDPDQARKFMDPNSLAEMTASIAKHGVLEPILFRLDEKGGLIIVAGERRVAAARATSLATIPAIFVEGNHREISLVENLLRENLTPVEEAEALDRIMKECNYSQRQLSEMIGKSQAVISQSITLTALPGNVRDQCRTNPNIPKTVLLDIAALKSPTAMQNKFRKYMERQSKATTPAVKPPVLPKAQAFLRRMDGLSGELSALPWRDWTEEEKEDLAASLRDMHQGTEDVLRAMGVALDGGEPEDESLTDLR